MIDALHNFPSIVMWVPFNEGWGQHDTPEIVAVDSSSTIPRVRSTKPAAGRTAAAATCPTSTAIPGPGMRPVEEERVVVLGEFGGLGMPVSGHTWQDEKNWGYVSFKTAEELTDAYVGPADADAAADRPRAFRPPSTRRRPTWRSKSTA